MNPNSTNIYYEGLLGHYENRSNEFENMCLAYYASHFEYIKNRTNTINKLYKFRYFGFVLIDFVVFCLFTNK